MTDSSEEPASPPTTPRRQSRLDPASAANEPTAGPAPESPKEEFDVGASTRALEERQSRWFRLRERWIDLESPPRDRPVRRARIPPSDAGTKTEDGGGTPKA